MRMDTNKQFDWTGSLEQLEDRLFMSADPVGGFLGGAISHHAIVDEIPAIHQSVESTPDFWIETRDQESLEDQFRQIDTALAEAHNQTGLNNVRTDYGFTGIGQTVAVIDSGIAYDHFALGNGFGSNYRVVGGWDFTGENDANPYDDGPSGSHGTHVAGIVGGDSGNDTGVAPGVDLVALRVFDDVGAGYFSWVENALDWVHTNRNNFENPITAINLSLGVSGWNAETIPSWANLEDEFAQLEADGIFIAVSAGNSFTSYNASGLSYPAASSHVIPVMSTDDSGLLSYFSQRSSRAIAAPGRSITSTVPDYAGNNNGITDDYATMSGTSMASPYVAGASVLVREAMEFVGYTNITQDTIYNHMIATSDSFFDSATNQSYSRLNLEAAIDALMPTDDYGSTEAGAYSLGTLSSNISLSGHIGTLNDKDFFTFTADVAGTVSMSVTGDHGLLPNCSVIDVNGTLANNVLSFDVVAGESYTLSLETAAGHGIGNYDLDLALVASEIPQVPIAPVTVKTVVASNGNTYSLDSENWLSINGNRLWSGTQDFSIASNQNFVWQSTSGILQRYSAAGWETLDTDATKHMVGANSRVYSLGSDNILSINGSGVWGGTNDFHIADDMAIYWQSSNGLLQRLPNGGPWQTLDTAVIEFAVRHDGAAFALTADGNVTVDGAQTWAGINDLQLDSAGQLVVVNNDGSLHYEAGSFALSSSLALQSTSTASQSVGESVNSSAFESYAAQGFLQAINSRVSTLEMVFYGESNTINQGHLQAFSQNDDGGDAFSVWESSLAEYDVQRDNGGDDFELYTDHLAEDQNAWIDEGAIDSLFENMGGLA